MTKIVSTFILICCAVFVEAQQTNKKDSLFLLLEKSKADTNRVQLLLRLADYYKASNQDSAVSYLEKSKLLSEALKYKSGILSYYEQSSVVSFTKGEYEKAMVENFKGLAIARELKDSSMVIVMLNHIGITYGYQNDYENELAYNLQVKKAVEAINDSTKLSGLYHNLANCYSNLKQYRRAVDAALWSDKLYTVYKLRNDYINRVYATLGQNYEGLRMTDSALFFYKKAIVESIKSHDTYAEATLYGYLAKLYSNLREFGEMLTYAERSLALARSIQSPQLLAEALDIVAFADLLNGNNKKATTEILEALQIATKDSLPDELQNSYNTYSYIAMNNNDFVHAMWAKQKYDSLREKVLSERIVKNTVELEKKYESAKKDNQLTLQQIALQRKSMLNYILIAAAAGVLLISLLVYRTFTQKQKIQQQRINELETEKTLMATQAVLKGEDQERTRLAKDLHDGLGGMLSGIKYSFNTIKGNLILTPDNANAFERSMDMLDSSIQEMRRVAHNMMPEALVRFGLDTALKDFCNSINNSGVLQISYQSIGFENAVIEQTTAITIYRIVQELINNTIRHAVAKTAIVQITKAGNHLSLTVEDDGKGFDTRLLQQAEKDNRQGIGWSNIQSRVEYLKGKVDVRSEPGRGTSTHIEFELA